MSLRGVWRRRFYAKLRAEPQLGADGWVENPFDKLDKAGLTPADRRTALVNFIGSAREVKPK